MHVPLSTPSKKINFTLKPFLIKIINKPLQIVISDKIPPIGLQVNYVIGRILNVHA